MSTNDHLIPPVSAADVAQWINGHIIGDSNQVISSIVTIDKPIKNSITFLGHEKYAGYLNDTVSRTIIVDKQLNLDGKDTATFIRVDNVYHALAVLLGRLKNSTKFDFVIHPTAIVHPESNVADKVHIGPFAVLGEGVKVGQGGSLGAHVYIGDYAIIGEDVIIYPGVYVASNSVIGNRVIIHPNAVIGSDGFGFVFENEKYLKIPQIGNVIIEDDVEIGSNTCIDRASIGSTIIRKGSKLDNLIQVGHNVDIGENVAIAAQAGISGSAKVGNRSQLGGQSGLAGHINIAPGSRIQAQSGVASDIKKENRKWYGSPVLPYYHYLRSFALFKVLPQITRRLEALEKAIIQKRTDQND